jgi:hypothetical protein
MLVNSDGRGRYQTRGNLTASVSHYLASSFRNSFTIIWLIINRIPTIILSTSMMHASVVLISSKPNRGFSSFHSNSAFQLARYRAALSGGYTLLCQDYSDRNDTTGRPVAQPELFA